jgi:hypothetical protein
MSQAQQKTEKRRPNSMLEVYMAALAGETGDVFLDEINLGTGNYTDAEYWQQVQAFRNGIYAESAVSRHVLEKAVRETKEAIVEAIFETPDAQILDSVSYPAPEEGQTQADYFDEYAEEIWAGLGTADMPPSRHKAVLVNEVTSIGMNWEPPHMRMLKMRHEASQSKGARALDNLFDRVKEFKGGEGMEEFQG